MHQSILVLIETAGTQRFVFGSNDLRENLGASELVRLATGEWACKILNELVPKNNLAPDTWEILSEKHIEDGQIEAELIFSGGGSLAVLFTNEIDNDKAQQFIYQISQKVLLDAPGLVLRAALVDFDFEEESLSEANNQVHRQIQESKPGHSGPLLGLGVTAADTSTGWPTIGTTNQGEPASAQRLAKLEAGEQATSRLRKTLAVVTDAGYEFTDQLDQLGGKPGDENYIAVVHIDGNGMAVRRSTFEGMYAGAGVKANRRYLEAIRQFSSRLTESASTSLVESIASMMAMVPRPEVKSIFPIRPIVFGGDDITLVCDGSYGVRLAVGYLQAFIQKELPDGESGYATAGVAIVKTHYPFERAYRLSEQLRNSSKERVVEVLNNKKGTAVDWHIASGGLLGGLKEIRKREYMVPPGNLTARPLMVSNKDEQFRDWDTFVELWQDFSRNDWRESRNKRAALRSVLREGPIAVEQFRHAYARDGSPLQLHTPGEIGTGENGWIGDQCVHYDALEALEFIELKVGGK